MPSRYSVIQYVPDAIADERINIGVLAFDDTNIRVQFLTDWERVQNFSPKNIDHLKEFARRMEEAAKSGLLFPGDKEDGKPRHERLEKVALGWLNSIQFTEPRGSLEDVGSLIEDTVGTFLVRPTLKKSKLYPSQDTTSNSVKLGKRNKEDKFKIRNRQDAARITVSNVKEVVREMIGKEYQHWVREKYTIAGTHNKKHNIDIVVANGHPYLAAQGISFEVNPPEILLSAIAWTIRDVKEYQPELPLAIVVLPPKKDESKNNEQLDKNYHETINTYLELGAKILQEDQIKLWVSQQLYRQELKQKICSLP